MLGSTSDDGANPDLASLSPSPIMSNTPSPSYPTSYKFNLKESQHKRLFNRNHDLIERMYGSDNGINIPNMKTGIKLVASNKTPFISILIYDIIFPIRVIRQTNLYFLRCVPFIRQTYFTSFS